MNSFSKLIIILPALCFCFHAGAQPLGDLTIRRGMKPFFLGSLRTELDSSYRLRDAGTTEYKGRTEYSYVYTPTPDSLYFAGGVYFKNIMLTYISDTLVRIHLNNTYTPFLYPDYEKRAKQEFRELRKFLREQWNSPGKEKTFIRTPDNRIVSKGLQWDDGSMVMKASFYEDKDKTHPLYSIYIELNLQAYE